MLGVADDDGATITVAYIPKSACPGNPQMRRYFPGLVAVNCTAWVLPLVIPAIGSGVSAPGNAGAFSAWAGSCVV
jgi:hypothetical protein